MARPMICGAGANPGAAGSASSPDAAPRASSLRAASAFTSRVRNAASSSTTRNRRVVGTARRPFAWPFFGSLCSSEIFTLFTAPSDALHRTWPTCQHNLPAIPPTRPCAARRIKPAHAPCGARSHKHRGHRGHRGHRERRVSLQGPPQRTRLPGSEETRPPKRTLLNPLLLCALCVLRDLCANPSCGTRGVRYHHSIARPRPESPARNACLRPRASRGRRLRRTARRRDGRGRDPAPSPARCPWS